MRFLSTAAGPLGGYRVACLRWLHSQIGAASLLSFGQALKSSGRASRPQSLRNTCSLGPGTSQECFVSPFGNPLVCSDVKGTGQTLLGTARSPPFMGDTDVFYSLLRMHRRGSSRPQSDRVHLSRKSDTQLSSEGPAVAAAQLQPLLLLLTGLCSERFADPRPRFRSLALGPSFPALAFKNITSHAGGFCCTTARIPDRFYICTLILLDASSLKLSQTHWPKSLRSPAWGGLTAQEFLTGSEGGGSWHFKHEKLHGHLALRCQASDYIRSLPTLQGWECPGQGPGANPSYYNHELSPSPQLQSQDECLLNEQTSSNYNRGIIYWVLPTCKALV